MARVQLTGTVDRTQSQSSIFRRKRCLQLLDRPALNPPRPSLQAHRIH